jgi:hypothetical protein
MSSACAPLLAMATADGEEKGVSVRYASACVCALSVEMFAERLV